MKTYYDRRAHEYDDWWLGRGLYADRVRPGWEDEVDVLAELIASLPPARTLDVACGTGFLTRHLRGDVVGLDQSERMLELRASRRLPRASCKATRSRSRSTTASSTASSRATSTATSKRPSARASSPRRGGSPPSSSSSASVPGAGDPLERWEERVLKDGSRWTVFKRVFTGEQLAAELGGGEVLHEGRWFVVVRA